jgi:hypothetical protein
MTTSDEDEEQDVNNVEASQANRRQSRARMSLYNVQYAARTGRQSIPTPPAHIGVGDIRENALGFMESLFYGQYVPQEEFLIPAFFR